MLRVVVLLQRIVHLLRGDVALLVWIEHWLLWIVFWRMRIVLALLPTRGIASGLHQHNWYVLIHLLLYCSICTLVTVLGRYEAET